MTDKKGSVATWPESAELEGTSRWLRPHLRVATKATLLGAIFLVVPILLYYQFLTADQEKRALVTTSVREQGHTVAAALTPELTQPGPANLPAIGRELARFANSLTTIKLMFRPMAASGPGGFYYVATSAPEPSDELEAERITLARQGVLGRLDESCTGDVPIEQRYTAPDGHDEVVTSVIPVQSTAGCWALVTSLSASALPGLSLGRPYYDTPEIRFAGAIYLLMALLTFTTFWSIWRGLGRFADRARQIRAREAQGATFLARNTVPELTTVAEEFDRMVDMLQDSARDIRRAAEDNAHAFKTPIAIIRQSLEPVARSLPGENARGHRAIGLIERSLDKLDGLVASSRRLDEATADLLDMPRVELDLARLLERVLGAHGELFHERGIKLEASLDAHVPVRANVEMLETVIENIIENAISFSKTQDRLEVRLAVVGDWADLSIADSGPGVSPLDLPRIFDRYFSSRPDTPDGGSDHGMHFGVGLWIVRRNVEALGGRVTAENRPSTGLLVRIRLPIRRALTQK
jgi:two-component system sensor histidine kinase ChvG